jgi:hypothetical protein
MRPVPQCPLRPGESCTLCNPGASGPQDCPTVYAVMTDPDLRVRLAEFRARNAVGAETGRLRMPLRRHAQKAL